MLRSYLLASDADTLETCLGGGPASVGLVFLYTADLSSSTTRHAIVTDAVEVHIAKLGAVFSLATALSTSSAQPAKIYTFIAAKRMATKALGAGFIAAIRPAAGLVGDAATLALV